MEFDDITPQIIGCAIEVHKNLGPGLLESTYLGCLAYELSKAKLRFLTEVPLPVRYKEIQLDCGYRIDILVEERIILELKSVEKLLPIHHAQVLTYLKLSNLGVGLLMNFNVELMKKGIIRIVN
jgi:GxxExxY protein